MENYLEIRDAAKQILMDLFPEADIDFLRITYGGKISCIFIAVKDHHLLHEKWEDISNAVAVYYQTKIQSEFERWNLYLFYVCADNVERGLKYRIENDPVSSRKIVIDNFSKVLSEEEMLEIVSKHVTNSNLKIKAKVPVPSPFVKDAAISRVLNKLVANEGPIKVKKQIDYDALLIKIERSFKDEI